MKQKRISRTEALQFLGCTERQLQRLAAKGKLTVEYVQDGGTRRATYAEAEIQALKEEMDAPEVRGIAMRPTTDDRPPATDQIVNTNGNHQSATDPRLLTTTNPLTLPPQALQVLQMLSGTSSVEAGKCVSVEEVSFDKLFVGADGATKMSGVKVARYSARA